MEDELLEDDLPQEDFEGEDIDDDLEDEEWDVQEGGEEDDEDLDEDDGYDDVLDDKTPDVMQNDAFYQNRISELEREVATARKRDAEYARMANLLNRNGYTGDIVDIADQIEAQNRNMSIEEVREERIRNAQYVEELVKNHPAIRQAEMIQQRQEAEMLKMRIDNDVRQIQAINPNIKSIKDLANEPNADIIQALVESGSTWADAYRKVVGLTGAKSNVDTKEHLKGTGASGMAGGEMKDIPPELKGVWAGFYPDLSPKELKKKYNSYLKRGGK